MIDQIASGAASGGLIGGALALLSHLTGGITDYFKTKQEMKARQLEMNHEATMFPLKLEAAKEQSTWDAFKASIEQAKLTGNEPGWAAAVSAITRPALTAALGCAATYIVVFVLKGPEQSSAARDVVELAALATGWWFGCRQLTKRAG